MSARLAPYTAALRKMNRFLLKRMGDFSFPARIWLFGTGSETRVLVSPSLLSAARAATFALETNRASCALLAGARRIAVSIVALEMNRQIMNCLSGYSAQLYERVRNRLSTSFERANAQSSHSRLIMKSLVLLYLSWLFVMGTDYGVPRKNRNPSATMLFHFVLLVPIRRMSRAAGTFTGFPYRAAKSLGHTRMRGSGGQTFDTPHWRFSRWLLRHLAHAANT